MATMTASTAAAAAPETAAPPAPGRLRSTVPSARVLRAINPFVAALLRSPVHRLLSGQVLLLTVTGRRSGRAYTFPVGYVREADTLTIVSGRHAWWKNLRGGAPVAVLLAGRQRTGRAEVIEDRAAVLAEVDRLMARYGRKGAGQRIGVALDTTPPPTGEDLALAMRGHVVIRLVLDGVPERGGA
jgi:deazaflavin-dependent oxidoreductase (nitroreductase family)